MTSESEMIVDLKLHVKTIKRGFRKWQVLMYEGLSSTFCINHVVLFLIQEGVVLQAIIKSVNLH